MSQNKPTLPTDGNGRTIEIPFHPVQSLSVGPMSVVTGVGHLSSTIQNPVGIVKMHSPKECFYKLQKTGSSASIATTDHYLPANTDRDVILRGHDRIRFLPMSSGALNTVYITLRG